MISASWHLNLLGGLLLALIATLAMSEIKSSSLVPKSLLLWPILLMGFGGIQLVSSVQAAEFLLSAILSGALILCGLQALLVNLRRVGPWPSGALWLGLVPVGLAFQFLPLFFHHVMGFLWMGIALTKVARERSPSLEGGTPIWILLFYVQAVLLASYR